MNSNLYDKTHQITVLKPDLDTMCGLKYEFLALTIEVGIV